MNVEISTVGSTSLLCELKMPNLRIWSTRPPHVPQFSKYSQCVGRAEDTCLVQAWYCDRCDNWITDIIRPVDGGEIYLDAMDLKIKSTICPNECVWYRCEGEQMAKKLLTKTIDSRIAAAFESAPEYNWMTAREVASHVFRRPPNKKEMSQVQRRIQKLYSLGFLVKNGHGAGSWWRIVSKADEDLG